MTTPQDSDWTRFWTRDQSKQFSKISWSKRRILNVINPFMVSGHNVLDAGCGSGFFSKHFCDQMMNTFSLDYSDGALKMAEQVTGGRSSMIKADLILDDLQELLQERVHIIFTDGLFEHFTADDQNRIMNNLISVLHDDGVIITFVPNRWSPWELIRPFYMPGIDETPFVLNELVGLNQRNGLNVVEQGGVNTLPFGLSPEFLANRFGMLLYTIANKKVSA